jgi:hypothetical protein
MNPHPLDAGELAQVCIALGPRVTSAALAVARELRETGRASSNAWRIFLEALHEGAGETAMNSPIGLAIQMAILGRINGDNENGNDASVRRQQSSRGAGFPIRR